MSWIGNLVAIGVVVLVAVFGRRLAVDLLGPGTALYRMAESGMYGSPQLAARFFEAITVWVPWLCIVGVIAGALFREFRRQRVTQRRPR